MNFPTGANHQSARVLLLLVLPGQLLFLFTVYLMKGGLTAPSPLLTLFYLSASLLQVRPHAVMLLLVSCAVTLSLPVSGLPAAVPGRLHGPPSVAAGKGSRLLRHPLPNGPGRPSGHRAHLSGCFPAVVHRGLRQRVECKETKRMNVTLEEER